MDDIDFSDIDVEVDPLGYGSAEIDGYSAKISHDKQGRSALEIARDELGYDGEIEKPENYDEKVRDKLGGFLENLAELGHTSCFYQHDRGVNLEVPRHTTMFLCQFDHPKNLQQSQRYTEAKEFMPHFSENQDINSYYRDAKELYQEMISDDGDKIRKEDARYVLPLGTAAKHIHHSLNLVTLANIYREMDREDARIPSMTEKAVKQTLEALEEEEPAVYSERMVEKFREGSAGFPVTQMFADTNKALEELGTPEGVEYFRKEVSTDNYRDSFLNLSNVSPGERKVEGFLTSMSLSAWHQFMRHDTMKQSVQSVYDAAKQGRIVVPPSIQGSEYEEEFEKLCEGGLALYDMFSDVYGDDMIELVPHALEIDVAFSLDHYNMNGGFMEDRDSSSAQWEIRDIAQEIDSMVGD